MVTRGPKGEKRPAEVVSNAVHVMKVLTGEETTEPNDGKDPAAKGLGAKGDKARAERMSPQRRSEIARAAAFARYGKKKP